MEQQKQSHALGHRIEQKAPAVCHKLEVSEADLRAIDKGDLIWMLFLVHLIREFETKVLVRQKTTGC